MLTEEHSLSEDHKECLQELMNVAYGSATAVIAEILNAFAKLCIPKIELLSINEFESYIGGKMGTKNEFFYTSQGISGDIKGESVFYISRSSLTKLSTYFDLDENVSDEDLKDIACELTNILSSSTVGKLAQEMKGEVSFSAPDVCILKEFTKMQRKDMEAYSQVIIISTLIEFEEEQIDGELIILTQDSSIIWIKSMLDEIIKEYF